MTAATESTQLTKIGFGSIPKDGGTFTFYRNLRGPLLKHGVDLRCISLGQQEAKLWDESFADEGCVLLVPSERNIRNQAIAFSNWCMDQRVDIVIGVNSVAILSALPHLSEKIRILSRCANAFEHGYRITMASCWRLSRIVALAPRQVEDLVNHYGVERSRITLIPNGASVERFECAARQPRGNSEFIRLGFLGRLEHKQKGVLFLPEILSRLKTNDVRFSLKIAGKGVHEFELRRKLRPLVQSGEVHFVGVLAPDEIAEFLAGVDVLLFPSQFEGSPNALIEAMMAGCTPAAWTLGGITDFLIEDGVSGLLAKPGDCRALADRITSLANDHETVQAMSQAVSSLARQRFSLDRVTKDYVNLISDVMAEPLISTHVKSWKHFEIEPAFLQPIWRRLIPQWLKKILRRLLFQLGLATRHE